MALKLRRRNLGLGQDSVSVLDVSVLLSFECNSGALFSALSVSKTPNLARSRTYVHVGSHFTDSCGTFKVDLSNPQWFTSDVVSATRLTRIQLKRGLANVFGIYPPSIGVNPSA